MLLVPFVFVTVVMVIALLGNSLVLIVFGCRWRSTGATKVYVLILAALDLLCAILDLPRELLTLADTDAGLDWTSRSMRMWCRISTFVTYTLNFTSAAVLIAIALSRFVKVMKMDSGVESKRVSWMMSRLKMAVLKGAHFISTVKGAKMISGGLFAAMIVVNLPVLIFFESRDSLNGTKAENCSENRTEDLRCHMSCYLMVKEEHSDNLYRFNCALFASYLIIAVILTALYGTILQRLWSEKSAGEGGRQRSEKVQSVVSFSRRSGSLDTLCRDYTKNIPGKRGYSRTVSESDAMAFIAFENRGLGPPVSETLLHQAANSKDVDADDTVLTREGKEAQLFKSSGKGDSASTRGSDAEQTEFPPVSYTAHMRSQLGSISSEGPTRNASGTLRRPGSVGSFQFSKHGHRAKQTTLVFILITSIYILSYAPFFATRLFSTHLGIDRYDHSSLKEISERSYVISNAANPLVYGLCNPYFRITLWKIFICRREVI